jgi:hypothetical protein
MNLFFGKSNVHTALFRLSCLLDAHRDTSSNESVFSRYNQQESDRNITASEASSYYIVCAKNSSRFSSSISHT